MLNRSSPTLAPVLRNRPLAVMILGVSILQLGLAALHLPAWPCPMLQATGLPCPGCGLTRATLALFNGDWQGGLTIHAFALLIPAALVFIAIALLPSRHTQKFIGQVEKIETHTGIGAFLLFALIAYWLIRLLFFHEAFIHLIRG